MLKVLLLGWVLGGCGTPPEPPSVEDSGPSTTGETVDFEPGAFCGHWSESGEPSPCEPRSGDETYLWISPRGRPLAAAWVDLQCAQCGAGEHHDLEEYGGEWELSLVWLDDPAAAPVPGVSTHFLCISLECESPARSIEWSVRFADGEEQCVRWGPSSETPGAYLRMACDAG